MLFLYSASLLPLSMEQGYISPCQDTESTSSLLTDVYYSTLWIDYELFN